MGEFDDKRKPKRGVQIDAPRIYMYLSLRRLNRHNMKLTIENNIFSIFSLKTASKKLDAGHCDLLIDLHDYF